MFLFKPKIAGLITRINSIKGAAGSGVDFEKVTEQILATENIEITGKIESTIHVGMPAYDEIFTISDVEYAAQLESNFPGDLKAQLAWAIRSANIRSEQAFFNARYAVIFNSQLIALRRLNVSSAEEHELKPIYEAVRVQNMEVWANFPFELWIGFLIGSRFVLKHEEDGSENKYQITTVGQRFLIHIIANKFPEMKSM